MTRSLRWMLLLIGVTIAVPAALASYIAYARAVPPWSPPEREMPSPNAADALAELAPLIGEGGDFYAEQALLDQRATAAELRARVEPHRAAIEPLLALLGQPYALSDYDHIAMTPRRQANWIAGRQGASLLVLDGKRAAAEGDPHALARRSLDAIDLGSTVAVGGGVWETRLGGSALNAGGPWLELAIPHMDLATARASLERLTRCRARWPTALEMHQRAAPLLIGYVRGEWALYDDPTTDWSCSESWCGSNFAPSLRMRYYPRRKALALLDQAIARAGEQAGKLACERQDPPNIDALYAVLPIVPEVKPLAGVEAYTMQLDLLRLMCALRIQRLAHGAYPAALDELAPLLGGEVPCDIFSHEPLRYEVIDGEYRLWSVGKDGVDHGGLYETLGRYANTDLVAGKLWQRTRESVADWVEEHRKRQAVEASLPELRATAPARRSTTAC